MAFEAILGAALVYLSRQDDGVSSRLRQARRTLDGAIDALASFAARGELVRLRSPLVQDFLIGILAARNPRPNGVLPSQAAGRLELSPAEPQHWPPTEGQYDANGLSTRLGEMALLGLAITYEETRTFLVGLTQASAPSPAARQQIGRASRTLISVVSSLGLDLASYEEAWRRVFTTESGSGTTGSTATPLSSTAPPNVTATSSTGTSNSAARSDHTHGHGDQAGGTLHASATPATPGFMSNSDKGKLDGIAPGATATPLSSSAPPSVATASGAGSDTSAARSDHTHGHGDQAGGTLHATATPATPGFMASTDKGKLDGIAPGATATPLSGTAPPNVAATSGAGSDTSAARSDHTHGHGDQAGGTLHATATPVAPGFMSNADKSKLDGVASGATATPLSGTAPPNVAAASGAGTDTGAARGDHTHGHGDQGGGTLHATATPATPGFMSNLDKGKLDGIAPGATSTPLSGAAPPNVAAASGAGSSTSAARSDHTHGHGNQLGGTLHALATPATPGFMSGADKTKLDAIPAGGNTHLQSIQLCAAKTQVLLPNSTFGVDGQVETFALNAVPDICTAAGTLHDFWVEGQFSPNVNVTITILRAPATGGLPSTTAITIAVPAGQFSASSAATLTVPAGERITATSNALWNHNGLVLRARLRA